MLLFHSDRMNKGSVSALTMNPDFTENRNISIPSYFYISGFSGIPHMRYYYIFLFIVYCGEGGVVQRSLQREKDSGDSGK